MSSTFPRCKEVQLPLRTDTSVCVQADVESRDVRIRFRPKGFLRARHFLYLYEREDGEETAFGPVRASVHVGPDPSDDEFETVAMEIAIALGESTVEKSFSPEAVEEIYRLIERAQKILEEEYPSSVTVGAAYG